MSVAGNRPATGSSERSQAGSYGSHEDPDNWYHQVQPAWSLDALWLRHRAVHVRRHFPPHEVPLSRIDPVEVRRQSDLGGWPRRVASDQAGLVGFSTPTPTPRGSPLCRRAGAGLLLIFALPMIIRRGPNPSVPGFRWKPSVHWLCKAQ